MRTIKFKGLSAKGWLYGDLIHNRGKVYIAPIGIASPFAEAGDFEVDESTIGQHIGLYGKNDEGIYEGDIIKLRDGKVYRVGYDQGRAMFSLYEGSKSTDIYALPISGAKIIGNIHDVKG